MVNGSEEAVVLGRRLAVAALPLEGGLGSSPASRTAFGSARPPPIALVVGTGSVGSAVSSELLTGLAAAFALGPPRGALADGWTSEPAGALDIKLNEIVGDF